MNVGKFNWLKGGKYRIPILRLLKSGPMLPSEIATALSVARSSVSRVLTPMVELGLIERSDSGTRTVSYYLTQEAKELLKFLEENRRLDEKQNR